MQQTIGIELIFSASDRNYRWNCLLLLYFFPEQLHPTRSGLLYYLQARTGLLEVSSTLIFTSSLFA